MLRYLTLCLTVSMLLFTVMLPSEAAQGSGCPSQQSASDVCHAPGTTAPSQVPVGKACLKCAFPTLVTVADGKILGRPAPRTVGHDTRLEGRVVLPDDPPPRG